MRSEDQSNEVDAASSRDGGIFRVLPPASANEVEAALIAKAQRGDREAMHRLLSPWNDRVFSFLLTLLRNRSDAEDAAQETFLRVVKGLPGYEHSGQFQAWIFRIARNQAALTATRKQRTEARESAVETEVLNDFPMSANDDAETDDRAQQLRAAVNDLPAAEREVVLLRLDEDLKFREIAERTRSPLNTVLGRMRNAMRRLHDQLQHFQAQ